jgi:hypothetical protein
MAYIQPSKDVFYEPLDDIDNFDDEFDDDEFVVTPELWALIEKSRQQARDGNVVRCRTWAESKVLLDSL